MRAQIGSAACVHVGCSGCGGGGSGGVCVGGCGVGGTAGSYGGEVVVVDVHCGAAGESQRKAGSGNKETEREVNVQSTETKQRDGSCFQWEESAQAALPRNPRARCLRRRRCRAAARCCSAIRFAAAVVWLQLRIRFDSIRDRLLTATALRRRSGEDARAWLSRDSSLPRSRWRVRSGERTAGEVRGRRGRMCCGRGCDGGGGCCRRDAPDATRSRDDAAEESADETRGAWNSTRGGRPLSVCTGGCLRSLLSRVERRVVSGRSAARRSAAQGGHSRAQRLRWRASSVFVRSSHSNGPIHRTTRMKTTSAFEDDAGGDDCCAVLCSPAAAAAAFASERQEQAVDDGSRNEAAATTNSAERIQRVALHHRASQLDLVHHCSLEPFRSAPIVSAPTRRRVVRGCSVTRSFSPCSVRPILATTRDEWSAIRPRRCRTASAAISHRALSTEKPEQRRVAHHEDTAHRCAE